jgi:uncharacterized protein YdeI (YjbR/CyaY-like superfamily)
LYVTTRRAWRSWLANHHATEGEVWLLFYNTRTGKARIPYNDAVEEALCYGWIDSTVKKVDRNSFAQRFSPRKPGSRWSEMNKKRVRRLLKAGKMTRAGLAAAEGMPRGAKADVRRADPVIARDILKRLRADRATWENFQRFPRSYRRIRLGWIEGARRRPAEFEKRLRYFLRMTAQNKRFGMVQ